jgi:hypothetical protein
MAAPRPHSGSAAAHHHATLAPPAPSALADVCDIPIICGSSLNCSMAARREGPSAWLDRLSLATDDMARA